MGIRRERQVGLQLGAELQGLPLKRWIEQKTSNLIEATDQVAPPVDLNPLIRHQKVKKVTFSYHLELPEWGLLKVENDGFRIQLARLTTRASTWSRWTLAHELSHTLLYDINQIPPQPIVSVGPSDADIEWLCNLLGRSLLMPSDWLFKEIDLDIPPFRSGNILQHLEDLARSFNVPWQIVGERVITDLSIWHSAILQFVLDENGADLLISKKQQRDWRLCWSTLPASAHGKVFIPRGHREKGGMRFPRAKGKFRDFMERIAAEALVGKPFAFEADVSEFTGSALGNLRANLAFHSKSQKATVAAMLKTGERKKLPGHYSQGTSLILALPLVEFQTTDSGVTPRNKNPLKKP